MDTVIVVTSDYITTDIKWLKDPFITDYLSVIDETDNYNLYDADYKEITLHITVEVLKSVTKRFTLLHAFPGDAPVFMLIDQEDTCILI